MIRRVMGSTMVLAVMLMAGQSVYAAPFGHSDVQHVKAAKAKLVSFNLRNDSSSPMKVKAGDNEMTLAPGKLTAVKLAEGTTIVAEETTPNFAEGSVIATVNAGLKDATLALK